MISLLGNERIRRVSSFIESLNFQLPVYGYDFVFDKWVNESWKYHLYGYFV